MVVGAVLIQSIFIGLRPNENIIVQLAARTMLGEGPFSDEVVVSNKAAGEDMQNLQTLIHCSIQGLC